MTNKKQSKMNKNGKSSTVITVGVIALVLILALIGAKTFGFLPQTALGTGVESPAGSGQYLATGATTVTVAGVDGLQQGTSVGSTKLASINGAAYVSGFTTASPGNKVDLLLVNGTGYHNAFIKGYVVPAAASDTVPASFNGHGSVTVTVFNTNNQVIDGSATNQTVATGGSYTMAIRMDGQDKKNTQDMRCILEASNGAKMDKVTLNFPGAVSVGTSKPNWYTLSSSSSEVYVYDIPAIVSSASVSGTIAVTTATAQSLAGTNLIISCNTKEFFLDSTTGKVAFDVEDSLGNKQSIASYSKTIAFS